jgi:hypothetical protein
MLMGEAKNDQEYAMINEGNRWLRRYSCVWLLLNLPRPIHKTNQAEEEREREREREITTSHVPKTRFPEYICFSDLIPLKRILCNSFNLQNNQHPKRRTLKKYLTHLKPQDSAQKTCKCVGAFMVCGIPIPRL